MIDIHTIVGILIGIVLMTFMFIYYNVKRRAIIRKAAQRIMSVTQGIYEGPHELRPARLSDFPNLDHAYYEQMMGELSEREFSFMGDAEDATLNDRLPHLRTLIRFMASNDANIRTGFWHLAAQPRKEQMRDRSSKTIELVSEFSDSHYIFTSNSPTNAFEPPKEFDRIRMTPQTPLDGLIKTHRLRLTDYIANNPNGASAIQFYSLDDIFASYQRALAIIAAHRKSEGFVTRDELRRIAGTGKGKTADTVMDEIERERKKSD